MSTLLDSQVVAFAPSATDVVPATPIAEAVERFQAESRERRLTSPRYEIRVSEIGRGPTLVVVQGMCSNRTLFASLAVALSSSFRVVLYDLPGVNRDDRADLSTYGPEAYIADLMHVLDSTETDRGYVMGNSFGTTIVQRTLMAHPSRWSKAMLVCGFARQPISLPDRLAMWWYGKRTDTMGDIPIIQWKGRALHGRELERRESGLSDFLLRENGRTPIPTVVHQATQVRSTDLRGELHRIESPVLVVHGKDDRLISPQRSVELVNGIRNAELALIPECGHIPHLSHPEHLARLAERFFRPD